MWSWCSKGLRLLLSEIDTSKLFLYHRDWRQFTYTPWLPYRRYHQLVYIAYRWIFVLYFCIWLFLSSNSGGAIFFIYLTNWAFLLFNFYLVIAALLCSIKYFHFHWIQHVHEDPTYFHTRELCSSEIPVGHWNKANNSLKWYQMIHWVFFTLGNGSAVCVLVLYWSLIYRGGSISGISANHHLLNGIFALLDVFICGLPVNFLHCIYLMVFSIVYSTFAGIYSLSSGKNIYRILDYQNRAGSAVILELLLIFLFIPSIQIILYVVYMGRVCLVFWMKKKFIPVNERAGEEVELIEVNITSNQ